MKLGVAYPATPWYIAPEEHGIHQGGWCVGIGPAMVYRIDVQKGTEAACFAMLEQPDAPFASSE